MKFKRFFNFLFSLRSGAGWDSIRETLFRREKSERENNKMNLRNYTKSQPPAGRHCNGHLLVQEVTWCSPDDCVSTSSTESRRDIWKTERVSCSGTSLMQQQQ